ncbi:hypothetical protein FRB95_008959 [Tulasnella sp. JGI-2019a]|nr:hypothetical protein FRB95_008959 [Tulasnella sp. JGI-2019a]
MLFVIHWALQSLKCSIVRPAFAVERKSSADAFWVPPACLFVFYTTATSILDFPMAKKCLSNYATLFESPSRMDTFHGNICSTPDTLAGSHLYDVYQDFHRMPLGAQMRTLSEVQPRLTFRYTDQLQPRPPPPMPTSVHPLLALLRKPVSLDVHTTPWNMGSVGDS